MKTLFLLFALLPAFCFSQNYQTIQSDVDVFFEPDSGICVPIEFINLDNYPQPSISLRALRMSVAGFVEDGYVLKKIPEIHDAAYSVTHEFETCVSPDQLSWIGGNVIINDNGVNVFFNRQNDSIFINTSASFGDSFVFYTYPDDSYFLASISAWQSLSFLGIADSAKTISLQFYTSDNQAASSPINDKELVLTKIYGFYKTLNFRDFPDFGNGTFHLREHTLYGHGNIPASFGKMTFRDIYDYEVGDEYHFKKDFIGGGFSWSQQTIKKVLNKEWVSADAVKYQFLQEQWGYEGPMPYYGFYHYIDTLFKTFSDLDSVISEALPFEPYALDNISPQISFNIIQTDNYNNRPALGLTNNGYEPNNWDTCFYRWWFDSAVLTSKVFVKGGGMLENYYSFDSGNEDGFYTYLLYFKKGNEEWGEPLTPPTIGIQENDLSASINIFPNPSTDKITIISNRQQKIKSITIFDPTGQIILQKKVPVSTIDISMLRAGLYFVEVKLEDGNVRRKLIVE